MPILEQPHQALCRKPAIRITSFRLRRFGIGRARRIGVPQPAADQRSGTGSERLFKIGVPVGRGDVRPVCGQSHTSRTTDPARPEVSAERPHRFARSERQCRSRRKGASRRSLVVGAGRPQNRGQRGLTPIREFPGHMIHVAGMRTYRKRSAQIAFSSCPAVEIPPVVIVSHRVL